MEQEAEQEFELPEGCRVLSDGSLVCDSAGASRLIAMARRGVVLSRTFVLLAEEVANELENVSRVKRLLEEVDIENIEEAARIVSDALRRAERLRSSISVKLCFAVVPHESVPGIKRLPEKVSEAISSAVKTARLEFMEAARSLPGVKLVEKGLVYIFFDERAASQFLQLFDAIVKPVVRRVKKAAEEHGVEYRGISDARCADVIMSVDVARALVEREVEALRRRAEELRERVERLRREGRHKALYRARKELEMVERKLAELKRVLSRLAGAAQ